MKDLTTSNIDRQNILNNNYAIEEIQKAVGFKGIVFEKQYRFIKKQIAAFFEVTERTIDNYIDRYDKELKDNGYEVLKGKRLKQFKLAIEPDFVHETNFMNKINQLSVFNFRSFLNLAMLMVESDKARQLRSTILDIVIDTINKKTGGGTKYINQRDEDFVVNLLRGEEYRREFTDALRDYLEMGTFKYIVYTNKIYKSIFKENADEYRKILKLETKENVRDTMYSEVLDLISSYEAGFAEVLQKAFVNKGSKLSPDEADILFVKFEKQRLWHPLREKARNKMASRDLCFRDALHKNIEEYISAVSPEDFDKFVGDNSKSLDERLKDAEEVFKRLKARE